MDSFEIYINDVITVLLFPFVYFIVTYTQRSLNSRLTDIHDNYQHVYSQVAGIRERLVKLEEEFRVHDSKEMMKYNDIKKAFEEIHATLMRINPDLKFNHSV